MHRFYYPNLTDQEKTVSLDDADEIHHLKNVLRFKPKDSIQLFNGQGLVGEGIIQTMSDKDVEISIKNYSQGSRNNAYVTLACALPKKAKFENIIEKCTELGIDEIIPLITERTEIKLDGARKSKREQRFQAISVNAAKQCKRTVLPIIQPITTFPEVLKTLDTNTFGIIPWLEGDRLPLNEALSNRKAKQKLLVFIGPEGDFTDGEVELAKKAGCTPVSLGDHTLKVDTAAISTVAHIKFTLDI